MTQSDEHPATGLKGRIKEKVGRFMGDRHVEAVGRVEAETGHEPDERELQEAEHEVRKTWGDIISEDDRCRLN